MPLQERILVAGAPGAGKTYGWACIARALPQHKFYVIDPDDGVRRVLYEVDSEGERVFPDLSNIEYYFTPKWYTDGVENVPKIEKLSDQEIKAYQGGVADAWKTIKPKIKPDDWVIVEHLGNLWARVQDGFADEVFSKDIGQYFLEQRKKMRAGSTRLSALEGWTDWCVDSETEILTAKGWKKYTGLVPGEMVFTIDPTGHTHFEPLLDIYVGPSKHRNMIKMTGSSHDSLTTQDHRWLAYWQRSPKTYVPIWKTSKTLGPGNWIPMTGIRTDSPKTSIYTDEFCELVGWYITDGWGGVSHEHREDYYHGGIGQSFRKHPQHVSRIREILTTLYGTNNGWCESFDGKFVTFNIRDQITKQLENAAPGKVPTYDFISLLTHEQLGKFIDSCVMGDGHGLNTGETMFYQVNPERVSVFEFACALYGKATRSHLFSGPFRGFGKHPCYTVNILKSKLVSPIGAVYQTKYRANQLGPNVASMKLEDYEGAVWCPQTPSGTWLAKRNGTVYFTGNSVINKLHNDDFIIPICFESPAHVYMTTAFTAVEPRAKEDAEIKAFYGDSTIRLEGQKHNPFRAQTILLLKATGSRDSRKYHMNTFMKDRGRPFIIEQEVSDFFYDYLVSVAQWM